MSRMYTVKRPGRDSENDDYIVMDELTNVVCLMNCRTNDVHWVTKHILNLEYTLKVAIPQKEDKRVLDKIRNGEI